MRVAGMIALVVASSLSAAETANLPVAALASTSRPSRAGEWTLPPKVAATHPLAPVLKFAQAEQQYLQKKVRDFTCRVTKRERINGELQDYMYLDLAVRQRMPTGLAEPQPYSVYVRFLAPKKIRDRRVLFLEGENDGKMLVRNGGERFSFVTVKIDPNSDVVKRESLVPITDIAFDRMFHEMAELLEKHIAADPQGTNTKVELFQNARVNDTACTRVKITHPQRQDGLEFHIANVYLDNERHVPIRLEKYLWPEQPDQEPLLDAEFTYTKLVLNPGLSASDFTRDRLKGAPR